MQTRLLRRSDLRPTRMSGVVGQKWRTSGYHWEESVFGYCDRARRGRIEKLPYLVHDVLERVGAIDGEANKDEVGFRIRERA